MIYRWKFSDLYGVDAQIVGEELERIYEDTGSIKPENVVERSRPENAPLHGCFEWRDDVAAEKYRQSQAASMIRSIITVDENIEREPVRAFVNVTKDYTPMRIVVESPNMMENLMQRAKRDMENFVEKYKTLERLEPVFAAIRKVL